MSLHTNNQYILDCLSSKQISLVGFADLSILDDKTINGLIELLCLLKPWQQGPAWDGLESLQHW